MHLSVRAGSQPSGKLLIGIGMQNMPSLDWRGLVLHFGFGWLAFVLTARKPRGYESSAP